jgi:hypothetical protein
VNLPGMTATGSVTQGANRKRRLSVLAAAAVLAGGIGTGSAGNAFAADNEISKATLERRSPRRSHLCLVRRRRRTIPEQHPGALAGTSESLAQARRRHVSAVRRQAALGPETRSEG